MGQPPAFGLFIPPSPARVGSPLHSPQIIVHFLPYPSSASIPSFRDCISSDISVHRFCFGFPSLGGQSTRASASSLPALAVCPHLTSSAFHLNLEARSRYDTISYPPRGHLVLLSPHRRLVAAPIKPTSIPVRLESCSQRDSLPTDPDSTPEGSLHSTIQS